jgi:hypothetical protein
MGAPALPPEDLSRHAYALHASGFTRLRGQLDDGERRGLRACCRAALGGARRARAEGRRLPFDAPVEGYEAASSLYLWSDAAMALLEHRPAAQLADALLGPHLLNDLTVFVSHPAAPGAEPASTSWHRDCSEAARGARSGHLWFWFCLEDLTERNGAPWVVPGSHRGELASSPAPGPPWATPDLDAYPSALCLTGRAGELLVVDARVLHTSGLNRTRRPRLLLNLGLIAAAHLGRRKVDHWKALDEVRRAQASPRARVLLGADLT